MDTPRSIAFAVEKAKYKAKLDLKKEFHKGKDGYTPKKGVDYFTDKDILEIRDTILALIPKPKDGVSPEIDYEMVFAYCFEKIAEHIENFPRPADGLPGQDGKDAVIDMEDLVTKVLAAIPKQKDKKLVIDKTEILKLIDERMQKMPVSQPVRIAASNTSIRGLTDVILDGVPQDEHGNYILTPGGGASAAEDVTFTPVGTIAATDVQAALEELDADIQALSAGSGIARVVVITSGNYTALATANTDYLIFVNGAHTVSLPAAAGNTSKYTIKNLHSANNNVDTVGAETIEGVATVAMIPSQSVDIVSNGTNYYIV